MSEPVYAAGAVCWRNVDGVTQILVVHRPRYGDITLPKGKVDPGESLMQTAVREVAEETGLQLALGAPLHVTEYTLANGRRKFVSYWAAEVGEAALKAAKFKPNDEIDGLEWIPADRARERLSYAHDAEVVDAFTALHGSPARSTFALILLRHAKAVARSDWKGGADAKRPLQPRGTAVAKAIVPSLRAWRPRRLISSPAVRCVATLTPLSRASGRRLRFAPELSQTLWDEGRADPAAIVAKRLSSGKNAVLCSHRPVLPDIVLELALATGTPMSERLRDAAVLEPGAFSVFHFDRENPGSGIVAIETHTPSD